MMQIPSDIISSSDPVDVEIYEGYKSLVRNIKSDSQGGLVIPSDADEHGNPHYKFSLVSSPGTQMIDTLPVIQSLSVDIALALMTDVILLGHQNVGSFALADSKTTLLASAIGGFLDIIEDVYNRHALPWLWRFNGMPMETMPRLRHGDIEQENIEQLMAGVSGLFSSGFEIDDLENEIRLRLGFPPREETDDDTDADPAPAQVQTEATDDESEVQA